MTARLLADSVTPAAMPQWVSVQAFYVDGAYAATAAQLAAWRGPKVKINVTGDPAHGGNMLDVEHGDASPDAIPAWYDAQVARGGKNLGVYCDRDQFDACTKALAGRRAARWLATLDGQLIHTYNGVALDACQVLGASETGANYDLSVIFNPDWHPEWDTEVPNPDIANLAHLAQVTMGSLGRLQTAIKRL